MQTNREDFRLFLIKCLPSNKAAQVMKDVEFVFDIVGRGGYTLAKPKPGDAQAVIEAANALLGSMTPKIDEALFVSSEELRAFERGSHAPDWMTREVRKGALNGSLGKLFNGDKNSAFIKLPEALPDEGFKTFSDCLPGDEFLGAMRRLPAADMIPEEHLRLDKLAYAHAVYRLAKNDWGIATLGPTVALAKRGLMMLDRKEDERRTCLCLVA